MLNSSWLRSSSLAVLTFPSSSDRLVHQRDTYCAHELVRAFRDLIYIEGCPKRAVLQLPLPCLQLAGSL